MLNFRPLVFLVVSCVSAASQSPVTFVPSSCETLDGPTLGGWPGFSQRFRLQALVDGAALNRLANLALTGLTVRRDGQYLAAHAGGRAHVTITLSHAARTPRFAQPVFAANRGQDGVQVFAGDVVLPDAPALSNRNQVTWESPHAVDFPFTVPFPFQGGTLCMDVDGAPVTNFSSPWWPVDYDLFTHDAQLSVVGTSCDNRMSATASLETMLPGGTLRLIGIGPMQSVGVALIGVSLMNPGLHLAFLRAPGCHAHVLPTLSFATSYLPPASGGYGGASVGLPLPSESYLLGALLHSQWLAFPNPINPGQLATTNALSLQLATRAPGLAGVTVRTGIVAEPAPLPAGGNVLPHLLPVMCLRAQ
jgi:hypothetical protein